MADQITKQKAFAFANVDRVKVITRMIIAADAPVKLNAQSGLVDHDPDFPKNPDFAKRLLELENSGCRTAIIDERSYPSRKTILDGISLFKKSARRTGANMQIIYIFGADEQSFDCEYDVALLIKMGVYDFLIPGDLKAQKKDPAKELADRIITPRQYHDVSAGFEKALDNQDQRAQKDIKAAPAQPIDVEQSIYQSTVKTVISVVTTRSRGGATTLSMMLARNLALCGKGVAVLTDKDTFDSILDFAESGNARLSSRTNRSLAFNGVTVSKSDDPSTLGPTIQYVIQDLGVLPAIDGEKPKAAEKDAADRILERLQTSKLKVAAIPNGVPTDFKCAADWLQCYFDDLNTWVLAIGSSTVGRIKSLQDVYASAAPQALWWSIPYCPGPFEAFSAQKEVLGFLLRFHLVTDRQATRALGAAQKPRQEKDGEAPEAITVPEEVADDGSAPRKSIFGRKGR